MLHEAVTARAGQREVDVIDYRSMMRPTPAPGWPEGLPRTWKTRLGDCVPGVRPLMKALRARRRPAAGPAPALAAHVPALARDFEAHAQRVLRGEVLAYELSKLRAADYIIINGEGNVVRGVDHLGRYRPGARYLLFIAYLAAKHLGKRVSLVNHVIDPGGNEDAEEMLRLIYPLLHDAVVRDPLSVEMLARIGIDREVPWAADALYGYDTSRLDRHADAAAELAADGPYLCLGDSSGLRSLASEVKWDVAAIYTDLIGRLRATTGLRVVVVDGFSGTHAGINAAAERAGALRVSLATHDYERLTAVLGGAELFVSGRWHASIMAALVRTPFVCWGSDSHKTRAMYTIYGDYPARFFDVHTLPVHAQDLADEAARLLGDRVVLAKRIGRYNEGLVASVGRHYECLRVGA